MRPFSKRHVLYSAKTGGNVIDNYFLSKSKSIDRDRCIFFTSSNQLINLALFSVDKVDETLGFNLISFEILS